MKCFHHTDLDGTSAAAVVLRALGDSVEMFRIDHKIPFPFEKIEKDEEVIIVDFSLSKDNFEKLLEITENVIWIDHHKTAIDENESISDKLKGLRRIGTAGGELCWEYYFPDIPVPKLLHIIGDYDVQGGEFGKLSDEVHSGCISYPTEPESEFWNHIFDPEAGNNEEVIELLSKKGKAILGYQRNYHHKNLIRDWSFMTEFEGYKACAVNAGQIAGKLVAKHVKEPIDIMISYIHDGSRFTISLYSITDGIDVAEIAEKFGGGGHKGAAGFRSEVLPFKPKE